MLTTLQELAVALVVFSASSKLGAASAVKTTFVQSTLLTRAVRQASAVSRTGIFCFVVATFAVTAGARAVLGTTPRLFDESASTVAAKAAVHRALVRALRAFADAVAALAQAVAGATGLVFLGAAYAISAKRAIPGTTGQVLRGSTRPVPAHRRTVLRAVGRGLEKTHALPVAAGGRAFEEASAILLTRRADPVPAHGTIVWALLVGLSQLAQLVTANWAAVLHAHQGSGRTRLIFSCTAHTVPAKAAIRLAALVVLHLLAKPVAANALAARCATAVRPTSLVSAIRLAGTRPAVAESVGEFVAFTARHHPATTVIPLSA